MLVTAIKGHSSSQDSYDFHKSLVVDVVQKNVILQYQEYQIQRALLQKDFIVPFDNGF